MSDSVDKIHQYSGHVTSAEVTAQRLVLAALAGGLVMPVSLNTSTTDGVHLGEFLAAAVKAAAAALQKP